MDRMLRLRLALTVVLVLLCGSVGVYPMVASALGLRAPGWLMSRRLTLGLDLKGGVQLVIRVETDAALRLTTEAAVAQMTDDLAARGITVENLAVMDSTHFTAEGVAPGQDPAFREVAVEAEAQFDRRSNGTSRYIFTMRPAIALAQRADAVTQARETIERRVNELGVTEPSISQQGSRGDELLVQLPGVDIDRAKDIIHATGLLELRLVEQGPAAHAEELGANGQPRGTEVMPGATGLPSQTEPAYWLVRKAAVITGNDLRTAHPTLDENNLPAISFTLNADGGRRFAKVTSENIGRQLAIVLDGRIRSVARIDGRIAAEGRLAGGFTPNEAQNLALLLRTGALRARLDYLSQHTIGPSLGADSIRLGITASVAGLLLVMSFMLAYYRLSGINAVAALLCNLVILLGLMAYLGAVMTLPGIAGFVLTMGIGVDSNVLIFERIKEELGADRGVRASIDAGFARVFMTLLDTHVAALISAGFLFQFGTGPIRGFAVTLLIGLASNLFTSTFVSKTLFELLLRRRQQHTALSI